MSHPVPFMKASNVTVTKKVGKEMPDLEEAIEEEDDAAADDPAEAVEDDELDIKGDKYIKQPKKKAAPKKATKAKPKAKTADDDDDDEDEPPAKAKGKAKAPAKPRGKAKK
jgi:replication factor C subunit 1